MSDAKYWDKGLNPLIHDCSCEVKNCWAKKLINRNLPGIQKGWFPERLNKVSLTGKPIVYFVQHLCDIAHPSVNGTHILEIIYSIGNINKIRKLDGRKPHDFLVLTKYPERLHRIISQAVVPINKDGIYIGTSVTGKNPIKDIERINYLTKFDGFNKWISCEPIYNSLYTIFNNLPFYDLTNLSQVIVGAETGTGSQPLLHPDYNWFRFIRDTCNNYAIPFFLKQIDSKGNRKLDGRTYDDLIWRW